MKITMHGKPLETNGQPPQIGDQFPKFELTTTTAQKISSAKITGKYTLISFVPDINTRVCSLSTKKFNQAIDNFPNINFLTISTNTPEQQKNWCAAEGVTKMKLVSDQDHVLGQDLGLYVAAGKFDSRSVWLLNPAGKIIYRELIIEQSNEPAYSQALNKLAATAK